MIIDDDLIRIENALFESSNSADKYELITQLVEIHQSLAQNVTQGFHMLARSLDRIGKSIRSVSRSDEMDMHVLACALQHFPISPEHAEEILYWESMPHFVSDALVNNIKQQHGFFEAPNRTLFSNIIEHLYSSQNWNTLLAFLDESRDKDALYSADICLKLHYIILNNLNNFEDIEKPFTDWLKNNESWIAHAAYRFSAYRMRHAFAYLELGFVHIATEIAKVQANSAINGELIKRQTLLNIDVAQKELFNYRGDKNISDGELIHYLLFSKNPIDSLLHENLSFSSWPSLSHDFIQEVSRARYCKVLDFVLPKAKSTIVISDIVRQCRSARKDIDPDFLEDLILQCADNFSDSFSDLLDWWSTSRQVVSQDRVAMLNPLLESAIQTSGLALRPMKLRQFLTDADGLLKFINPQICGWLVDQHWPKLSHQDRLFLRESVSESIIQQSNYLQRDRLERDIGL